MATHDYVIANNTGANVRSDINGALAAIVSNNSSSSEPATTYAYQWWADTNANVLKIRNSANNAWITLRELDGTMLIEDGSASTPGLAFADDVNTGIFSGAADQIGFATGGVERLEIGSSEIVVNDPSNDVDFRVESNGNTHMLFVEGGTDRVGIGESDPDQTLHISEAASGTTMGVIIQNTATADDSDARLSFNTNSGGAEKTRGYIQATGNTANDGNLIFATRKSGSTTESVRIDNSGHVGIGGAPSVRLDVKGTANSEYMRVGGSSRPLRFSCSAQGAADNANHDIDVDSSAGSLSFSIGTNERTRVTSNGLTFNGDTAAANALDDYEEGTWTPVLAGGTSAGTYTYGTQVGFYTKIGRKVYVTATLNNIASSSVGSGELRVTGLPFTAGTGSSNIGQVFLDDFNFSNNAGTLCSIVAPSESYLTIREVVDDGSDTTMSVTDRNSSSSDLVINCTYIV